MDTREYELHDKYKTGFDGHCGMYVGLQNAIDAAKERLLGNKDLVAVYIVDRKLEQNVGRWEWIKRWETGEVQVKLELF